MKKVLTIAIFSLFLCMFICGESYSIEEDTLKEALGGPEKVERIEGENYIFEMKNVSFYAEIGSGELKGTSFKLSKDIVLVFDGKGNYRELR